MGIGELSEILGNIGDFVGSVAVLVTLIYLAVQVKHSRELLEENRKISLSQVYQTRVGFRIQNHLNGTNPMVAEVVAKVDPYSDPPGANARYDNLTKAEQQQYKDWQAATIQVTDNSLYQFSLGLISELQIEGIHRYVRVNYLHWQYVGMVTPLMTELYENSGDA